MRRLRDIDKRSSRMATGHQILLITTNTPECPHHKKRAIFRERYDEIGVTRWFCIDCVAHAIYDHRK